MTIRGLSTLLGKTAEASAVENYALRMERDSLRAALTTACAEQIRLSLAVLTLTNERDEARALGRMA